MATKEGRGLGGSEAALYENRSPSAGCIRVGEEEFGDVESLQFMGQSETQRKEVGESHNNAQGSGPSSNEEGGDAPIGSAPPQPSPPDVWGTGSCLHPPCV